MLSYANALRQRFSHEQESANVKGKVSLKHADT